MHNSGHTVSLIILSIIALLLSGYIYKLKKFTSRTSYVGIVMLGLVICLFFMALYMEFAERYHFEGFIKNGIIYIYYGFLCAE